MRKILFAFLLLALLGAGCSSIQKPQASTGATSLFVQGQDAQPEVEAASPKDNGGDSTKVQSEKPASQPKDTTVYPPNRKISAGMVVAYVVDQYGKPDDAPLETARIYDALGEEADIAHIDKGRLISSKPLPPGTYAMRVPYIPEMMGVTSFYGVTPTDKQFQLPPEGIDLGTIVITRWGKVMAKFVNAVGTSLDNVNVSVPSGKCDVTDSWVLQHSQENYCAGMRMSWKIYDGSSPYTPKEPNYVGTFPSGDYTVKFSLYGYENVVKTFSVQNKDVELGTIVLQKKN